MSFRRLLFRLQHLGVDYVVGELLPVVYQSLFSSLKIETFFDAEFFPLRNLVSMLERFPALHYNPL